MTAFARSNRSAFGRWFWTVDRVLLGLVLLLIGLGLIAVAAASPAGAARYSSALVKVPDNYFFGRQLMWVGLGVPLMLAVSLLPVRWAKRLGLAGAAACFVALFAVPFLGSEQNGAVRWIDLPGFTFQPSEFLKPLFVVATAWMLSVRFEDRGAPVMQLSFGLLVIIMLLLVRQPDFGQTALFAVVWLVQATLAGLSLWMIGAALAAGVGGLGVAYVTSEHFARRIDQFLLGTGDRFQIERALDCFRAGGLFGSGAGEGQRKFDLPEPHTDYIFSVIGEEFGLIACVFIALVYLAIVVRVAVALLEEDEPFVLLAAAGLTAQFGGQALINMMVNVALLPAKGMTLPFISHGGSSFLALSLGMGLLLALTRRNRFAKASPYLPAWRGG